MLRATVDDSRRLLLTSRPLERFGAQSLERESGQLFLWLPVALAAGIGAYFSLPVEPPAAIVVLAGLALVALLGFGWRRQPSAIPALLAASLAGFLLARLDAAMSGTPLVASVSEALRFEGVIEDVIGAAGAMPSSRSASTPSMPCRWRSGQSGSA